jgi:uncharacterized repeat protein (TIGR01451 family)
MSKKRRVRLHQATFRAQRCAPRRGLVIALAAVGCMISTPSAMATLATPAWTITSARAPTNFIPGDHSGADSYLVTVTNNGAAPSNGTPITITDALPTGLVLDPSGATASEGFSCSAGPPLSCTGAVTVPPGGIVTVEIPVDVAANAPESSANTASVSGGGGASFASTSEPTTVSAASAGFGLQSVDGTFTNADGSSDTQAGSHPYEMTTSLSFNTALDTAGKPNASGSPKDIEVMLPPGVVGDPEAVAKCTFQELRVGINEPDHGCPIGSQIGVVTLRESTFVFPNTDEGTFAVYNMLPPGGKPAELGFQVANVPVLISANVRTGSDYGLTAALNEVSAALPITGSTLTVWGVPADPSHDTQRCPDVHVTTGVCDGSEPAREPHSAGAPPVPFITLPTSCAGPQTTTIKADSWQEPGHFVEGAFLSHDEALSTIGLDGCDRLDFSPLISAQPDTTTADAPTGLDVEISVPQNENPEGLAEANLRTATVTLPPGITVDPSAANGLAACTEAQIGLHDPSPPTCPDASKIGSVEVHTPLLPDPLVGSVYLAQQNQNPFGSLLAIYVTAEGNGVLVKLAGHVEADPQTGQLTTTFTNNPQLPFSNFKLALFGGPRAGLATPEACGTFQTTTSLTPWSAPESGTGATPGDTFGIGAGCVNGFSPSFTAGSVNSRAGAYTPLTLSFSRADTDQELSGLSIALPPGLLADIASVPLCSDAEANAGTCPAASQIGTVRSGVGPGPDPFFLPGNVYLTGPYKGGPYGLAVAVPAVAGPFNLGTVIVRQSIRIDPHDAHVSVTSDPLPTILDGIPLRLRRVDVSIDRPNFTFNPTNCTPMAITGTLSSVDGLSAAVGSRFQLGDCTQLPFKPRFSVSTQARTSKANGASLHVKVASGPGQANIGKVKVDLPKQLPSRLTTLQKACTAAVFEANPAACPPGSVVGQGTAVTPVLKNPLTGPAYLVSHGGEAFPDLVIVLQGEGITLDLVGNTDITKGITSSTFNAVPDAPVSTFDLVLPEGPHSVLATNLPVNANRSLCGQSLRMPTQITGQNGAVIKQTTKIAVSGCRALTISNRKLSGRGVTLTLFLAAKGTMTISGYGLKRYRKTLGAGSHQVKVALSKAGLSARGRHRKIKIKVALKSGTKTSSATTTLKL